MQLLDERYSEAAEFVRATAGDAIALVRSVADEVSADVASANWRNGVALGSSPGRHGVLYQTKWSETSELDWVAYYVTGP